MHGHGHGCAADHHRREYTDRQRADLDLVLAFNTGSPQRSRTTSTSPTRSPRSIPTRCATCGCGVPESGHWAWPAVSGRSLLVSQRSVS